MAACVFRVAALIGAVICLQKFASADLVITFYQQDDAVWMSLSGTGTVPAGSDSTGSSLDFLDFTGAPFLSVTDSAYTFSDGVLNLNDGSTDYTVTELDLINDGTGQSDLSLTIPGADLIPNNTYTFSGAARVVGLELSQLALGTYMATGGDADTFITVELVSTPEPASLALMGVGALGLYVSGRRRRKHPRAPAPDDPATLV